MKKETDSLPKGETKVETAGVDGLVRTTYEVTTQDGKEVSRTPIAQVIVTIASTCVCAIREATTRATPS